MHTRLFIIILLLAGSIGFDAQIAFAALRPGGEEKTCIISETQDCASFIADCKKNSATIPYEKSGVTPRTLVCSDRCTPSSSETCVPFQNACTAAGHLPVSYGSTLQCADSCGIASTADACAAFKSACTAAGKKYESNGVAVYCNTAGSIPGAGSSRGGGGKGIFTPMVGIPGLDTSGNYTFVELINKLYIFLIAIGAVIGVIKIAFAGVKWATSASGGSISAAKEDIKGVLLGLIILMVPYIVLSIINPKFTNLDVLKLDPLNLPATQNGSNNTSSGGAAYTQQCPVLCLANAASGFCSQFIKNCNSGPGTAEPVSTNKEGFHTYGCKVVPKGSCPSSPAGNGASEQTCGLCEKGAGCIPYERACKDAGGVVRVIPGDTYKSTCVVTTNTCPDLPIP